ncbi:DNA-deoxyinosine glycosylase [Eubacterium sp. MSJ-13]|uniref:DNA-deoxyinosine glycosylase n=1 Tax=Eubacterium sp. MSJ-13 TaxID=2841513 RepID=UPI001C0F3CAC|nr:DNA-deoxyinosine glycosylase [Eubacterium sp. MSJ-13]MBU5479434.1 DNA-deoxyinosine glycosylase [Eubacterium sp. MSJ-13]
MNSEYTHIKHEFEAVFDKNSEVLILGTLPSVKSRENNFYYGHPQNRFWKLIAALCQEKNVPQTIESKKEMLLRNHIAVWDVISECDIIGSSDSSIKNVVPTDLSVILDNADIDRIYANGGKAYELYMKYQYDKNGRRIIKLPSTSPANAAYSLERLKERWEGIV